MSILINKNTRVICQGITGKVGRVPHQELPRIRHEAGRRRHAGQGRRNGRACRSSTPCAKPSRKTGADATMIFVPAAFTADAILEAVDAGIKVVVAITEGVPVLDMVRVYDIVKRSDVGADRPELPRRDHARRMQDRHHARLHPQEGPGRRHEPQRHAHLRSRLATHEPRPRPIDLRRPRRRPDRRHVVHRPA